MAAFLGEHPRCHACALPLPLHLPVPTSAEPDSAVTLANPVATTSPAAETAGPEQPPPNGQCPACVQHPPPLVQCVAAVDYGFPWHTLIQRFKFQGEVGWAGLFAQVMWQAPHAQAILDGCDWWLPLPLSAHRLGERGYNQSWELVKQLARLHGTDPSAPKQRSDWLLKLGDTPDQHGLGRAQRLHNLGSAFSVAPAAMPHLSQRHVLLIDDVMTTGATLHAAALALRRAGASAVSALVLARTPAAPLSPDVD